jgi:hypothetical protein
MRRATQYAEMMIARSGIMLFPLSQAAHSLIRITGILRLDISFQKIP